MKIDKGTIVFTSEIGYYNFFYPTKTEREIVTECEATMLNHWIKYDNKYPMAIPQWALDPTRLEDRTVVVWIDNDKLRGKNVY